MQETMNFNLEKDMNIFEDGADNMKESPEKEPDSDRPNRFSPEWQNYLMGLFTKDELQDNRPTCDGLKRVSQQVLGQIVRTDTVVHNAQPNYAAVTVRVFFQGDNLDGISGSAESHHQNTDDKFRQYPLAVAETRAFSRALKTALGFKGLAAEESSKVSSLTAVTSNDEERTEGSIAPAQIEFIQRMATKLKVKAVESAQAILGHPVTNLEKLTHAEAISIGETFNSWSHNETEIPEAIKSGTVPF